MREFVCRRWYLSSELRLTSDGDGSGLRFAPTAWVVWCGLLTWPVGNTLFAVPYDGRLIFWFCSSFILRRGVLYMSSNHYTEQKVHKKKPNSSCFPPPFSHTKTHKHSARTHTHTHTHTHTGVPCLCKLVWSCLSIPVCTCTLGREHSHLIL